ncbi:MAG: hypothetical protein AAFY20_04605 [Cyanobacteria bacterium J06639_14]
MLHQLVRPLVRSQVQMLAQTPSANVKLVGMVSQWLAYLGVHAEVTQLKTEGDRIQVSLRVGKPEQCTEPEWRQILMNLNQNENSHGVGATLTYQAMTAAQKSKVHRLLACVLQASNENLVAEWDGLRSQLVDMGLEESMLLAIQSAMRVSMPMELLVTNLEPEVAAFALSKAISIALMDQQINEAEDTALKALLNVLQGEAKLPKGA